MNKTCGLKPPMFEMSSVIKFLNDQAPRIRFEGYSADPMKNDISDLELFYIGRGSKFNAPDEFELFCTSAPALSDVGSFKEFSRLNLTQCTETLK